MFNFFFFKKVIHFYFTFYFKKNKNVFFIYYKVLNSFKLLKKQLHWIKNVNFNNKQLRSHLKVYSHNFNFHVQTRSGDFTQQPLALTTKAVSNSFTKGFNYDFFTNSTFSHSSEIHSRSTFRVQSRSVTFPFSKKGKVI